MPKLLKLTHFEGLTCGSLLAFRPGPHPRAEMAEHMGGEERERGEVKEKADDAPGGEDIICLIEAKIGDCIFVAWQAFSG